MNLHFDNIFLQIVIKIAFLENHICILEICKLHYYEEYTYIRNWGNQPN
jgi:hypothetical protein